MSCSLRDAGTLEARGIPTITLCNDAFEATADAVAAMLGMPPDYVARRFVWLPHPTENLTAPQACALIDERVEDIRAALLAQRRSAGPGDLLDDNDPLVLAGALIADLVESVRRDGAALQLDSFANGLLRGHVTTGSACGDSGACLIPTQQLAKMVEALLRQHLPELRGVELTEIQEDGED